MGIREEMLRQQGWVWRITATYNDTVKWPKVPGEIAIETVHKDDVSKDIELEAFKSRTDVDIEVTKL
ncbi:MAG: hypothetical protein HMLIMOIP_002573 [Candidatus Nitrosomirales archaeon]|jgi:hypothetical protein